ncbi:MAG TPA: hypothetical protein VFF86_09965 [Candidatus Methylomirabilis sp.]|nr:hypothetical protein [Candidatus Methylomirabilis sp.]
MARAIKRTERVKGGNVNLFPSTWEALRIRAFQERTTISEQVRRAVAAYLVEKRGTRKQGRGGHSNER